jgi:carboxylesterase type B
VSRLVGIDLAMPAARGPFARAGTQIGAASRVLTREPTALVTQRLDDELGVLTFLAEVSRVPLVLAGIRRTVGRCPMV